MHIGEEFEDLDPEESRTQQQQGDDHKDHHLLFQAKTHRMNSQTDGEAAR